MSEVNRGQQRALCPVVLLRSRGATEGQNAERATTAVAESVHRVTVFASMATGSTN
jgi:hypothetical protein